MLYNQMNHHTLRPHSSPLSESTIAYSEIVPRKMRSAFRYRQYFCCLTVVYSPDSTVLEGIVRSSPIFPPPVLYTVHVVDLRVR